MLEIAMSISWQLPYSKLARPLSRIAAFLISAAPLFPEYYTCLFKEELRPSDLAVITRLAEPIGMGWPGVRTRLSASDHQMNSRSGPALECPAPAFPAGHRNASIVRASVETVSMSTLAGPRVGDRVRK